MNFKEYVQWFKDNFQEAFQYDKMYVTETDAVLMISRPNGQIDNLDSYLTILNMGSTMDIHLWLDYQQDVPFVATLSKEEKLQLKGMWAPLKKTFLSSDASQFMLNMNDNRMEQAREFMLSHKNDFIWTLPVKEKKKKEKKVE